MIFRRIGIPLSLSIILPLSLNACSSKKTEAENVVIQYLKDPESARFGEFYFNKGTNKACLAFDAHNSFGGYAGEKIALLSFYEQKWSIDQIIEGDISLCRTAHADHF